MGVRSLDVHGAVPLLALFLAMGARWSAVTAMLAGALAGAILLMLAMLLGGLALLIRLPLLALALVLLRAVLARSTASATPSAASSSGVFTGRTVRSIIHIVFTRLLCVTWAI